MIKGVFKLFEKDDKLANLSPPDWVWAGFDRERGFANELKNIVANPMIFDSDGKTLKDYHYCFSFRLFSDRIKQDIEEQLGFTDNFIFQPCTVMHGGTAVPYWCLVFTRASDVLDKEATVYSGPQQEVIKPVISLQKVDGLDIFSIDVKSVGVYVSDRVRSLFRKYGAIGIEISKTASAP